MLQLQNVNVTFPPNVRALDKVNLQFRKGQFTVLLGQSGAGKSTLLRCLNLLQTPSNGLVVGNENLCLSGLSKSHPQLREHRRFTAMVFQMHQLILRHNAAQNVLVGMLAQKPAWRSLLPTPRKDLYWAMQCLERVGLLEKALTRCDQLSGGQRQRVGIARALAQRPQYLLADEPVASLDPGTANKVLSLIRKVCNEDHITAIVSLHQVELAREYAQRVIGLADGQVVFDGPPHELSDHHLDRIYKTHTTKTTPPSDDHPKPLPPQPRLPRRSKMKLNWLKTFSIMLAALCCVLPGNQILKADTPSNPDTLRVALLPDENANTIIKNNRALQDYLEHHLNKKIQLIVTTDYSSMIEAMRRGRIELAYFGPLSYVMAKSKAQIEPFAALVKKGSKTYKSVLIASTEAGITKIEDIKGKTVAFGDPASTSSHLIPKSIIAAHGLKIDNKDYKEVFLGAHDAVAINIQNGNAQAGGLSYPIFESLVKKGVIKESKVKILTLSEPFPQYPWTMQSNLDPQLKERIKKAFYDLNKNDYANVLKPFKADGFAPIEDKDYQPVRDLISLLGLDPSKF